MRSQPPCFADPRRLRRLRWHYRAESEARKVEAAVQRSKRASALPPLAATLIFTAMARRPYRSRLPSIRSVITGRPCVRLARRSAGGNR
jgi:hypothetical protein